MGLLKRLILVGLVGFVAIQVVRPARTNPASDPNKALTKRLVVPADVKATLDRSCRNCHSNDTVWPWYSNVAPISWALSDHVDSGRGKLNFSEFDKPQDDADKAADVTNDGGMPPDYYTRFGLHAAAQLSDVELAELVAGLQATPGLSDD